MYISEFFLLKWKWWDFLINLRLVGVCFNVGIVSLSIQNDKKFYFPNSYLKFGIQNLLESYDLYVY